MFNNFHAKFVQLSCLTLILELSIASFGAVEAELARLIRWEYAGWPDTTLVSKPL